MTEPVRARSLDHVALWVSERELIADLLCRHLGMHVIGSRDDFTLVGVDAKEGKLTLFDAEPPRERGVLERVVLRVRDLDGAVPKLPPGIWTRSTPGAIDLAFPDQLHVGLIEAPGVDYDLDHVVLRVPDPGEAASGLADLGFARRDGELAVANRHIPLDEAASVDAERPLLNHL